MTTAAPPVLDATPAKPAATAAGATSGFVHLHVHTEFSKQDGLSRLRDIAAFAAANNTGQASETGSGRMPAVAMTDHGTMGGSWKFAAECKKVGIKPILGVETYMALVPEADEAMEVPGEETARTLAWDDPMVRFVHATREFPDAESGKVKRNSNNHLTMLARTKAGWRKICAMLAAAEDSFYSKPLIDYALLRRYALATWDEQSKTFGESRDADFALAGHDEPMNHISGPGAPGFDGDVIVLTGCLGGPVASWVAQARTDLTEVAYLDMAGQEVDVADLTSIADLDQGDTDVVALRAAGYGFVRTGTLNGVTKTTKVVGVEWDEDLLDNARIALGRLVECVGRANVYVEIMEHGLGAEGKDHIRMLTALADEAGVAIVATNDSHFTHDCDHDAHDSWLVNGQMAQATNKKSVRKDDPNRWRFNGSGYHLRTEAEIRALYSGKRWQEACDNTVRIAERVEDEVIPFTGLRLPKFPLAEGETAVGRLHDLVLAGAKRLYPLPLAAEVKERLRFEEDVIATMGLADYFLIVHDVIEWARSPLGLPVEGGHQHDDGCYADPASCPIEAKKPILVGPGRGSAAGSIFSYCLGITRVEPLRNGLLFERFLNPDRLSMPDIDVDFESARRDEVYLYLAAKYGEAYIARIGAWQVAKTKRAIKDAARVLEMTQVGEQLTALVPVHQGQPQTFAMLFEEVTDKDTGRPKPNPEGRAFRDLVAAGGPAAEIVALARVFENVAAGESIHAAGVIIGDEPLTNVLPLRRDRSKGITGNGGTAPRMYVSTWDGVDVDAFGTLKLDALSLNNLDFLTAAADFIASRTGEVIDLPNYILPDPDDLENPRVAGAYDLIRRGETQAVFQLESRGMTELAQQVSPDRFSDLSALVALYRPGPMGGNVHTRYAERKNGREPVTYDYLTTDPAQQEVLAGRLTETYGLIYLQETMMQLAGDIAAFTPGERDGLRKAIGKKKKDDMEKMRAIFFERGVLDHTPDGEAKTPFDEQSLANIWEVFKSSAEYAFNNAHSAAYGYVAWITALIKAAWPTEYAAAVLSCQDKDERRAEVFRSLREQGVAIKGPDVNVSMGATVPDPDGTSSIRLGLAEIRDVGASADIIIAERERGGAFTSLDDFLGRISGTGINSNALVGLIEAGALDGFGHTRLGLSRSIRALADKDVRAAMLPTAQGGAGLSVAIPKGEWSAIDLALRERIRLGVLVGEHPASTYRAQIKAHLFGGRFPLIPLHKALSSGNDARIFTAAVVTGWEERATRRGGRMVRMTLDATNGSTAAIMFERDLANIEAGVGGTIKPAVGDLVAVSAKVQTKTITTTSMSIDPDGQEVEIETDREITELLVSRFEPIVLGEIAHPETESATGRRSIGALMAWAKNVVIAPKPSRSARAAKTTTSRPAARQARSQASTPAAAEPEDGETAPVRTPRTSTNEHEPALHVPAPRHHPHRAAAEHERNEPVVVRRGSRSTGGFLHRKGWGEDCESA